MLARAAFHVLGFGNVAGVSLGLVVCWMRHCMFVMIPSISLAVEYVVYQPPPRVTAVECTSARI